MKSSPWSRFLPALGIVLAAVLAAAAVALWLAPAPPAESAAAETGLLVTDVQALAADAGAALAGDTAAFARLERGLERIAAARAELEARGGAAARFVGAPDFAELDAAAAELGAQRDALERIGQARARLLELAPELLGAVGDLASVLSPVELAANQIHLQRLELTVEEMQQTARSLPGTGSAGLASLGNAAEYLDQIIRGLRGQESSLDVASVSGQAATANVDAANDVFAETRRTIGELTALSQSLETAAMAAGRIGSARGAIVERYRGAGGELGTAAAAAGPGGPGFVLVLAALGIVGLMMLAYWRARDFRRAAQIQAEQNERNQQAILRLLDELSSLADGDLTVQATVTEDITGAIADSINYAIEALRDLVVTVNESAILVDAAAKQTEATSQHLLRTSETQSKQAAAASDSIAQMAASVEEVSGNAERCADVAHHAVDVAHKGGEAVRRTIEGMNAIRETIQDTSKRIKRLGESSQEIGNIVELIEEIAEQTNILALNASIEASRAGESSRGFAVVADEVQKLAERSANATRKIEVLVSTIQSDTNEAVISMERSTTDVVGGALLAENAGAALDEIEQVSHQIASLVQNISSSARDQTKVSGAINRNMQVLRQISAKSRESTAATSTAISKLSELASQLRRTVSGFKLPDDVTGTGVLSQTRVSESLKQVSEQIAAEQTAPAPDSTEQRRRYSG